RGGAAGDGLRRERGEADDVDPQLVELLMEQLPRFVRGEVVGRCSRHVVIVPVGGRVVLGVADGPFHSSLLVHLIAMRGQRPRNRPPVPSSKTNGLKRLFVRLSRS